MKYLFTLLILVVAIGTSIGQVPDPKPTAQRLDELELRVSQLEKLLTAQPRMSYSVPSYSVPSYSVPSYSVPSYSVPNGTYKRTTPLRNFFQQSTCSNGVCQ